MLASEKILEKFKKNCNGNQNLLDFLVALFDFESTESVRWTSEYEKCIEKYFSFGGDNEDT